MKTKSFLNFLPAVSAYLSSSLASLALIGGLSSCAFDDTELQNSIDDLTSRVEALEDFQEQVQGDITSLQDIVEKLGSSVTVDNVVDNGDGSWTINFSDGTSVTIRNGQDGEDGLTPPSITVVEEDGTYYWAYENADGSTDFILDDDGNRIPVTGEAPRVRINPDSGNWEISTDGGQTWEDTGVKAEGGSGDSFFSDVYVKDGILYLVLADGTVIDVPMTAELSFDFGTEADTLYFGAGESRTLAYTMSGAESVTITKPDGWRASIEAEGLVITAPAAENTFAETEGVISVILFAANGQSLLAEQIVKIGEDPDAAKVIDFPDANLKAYLVENYDLNGDGEIDTGEAAQITDITLNTAYSTDDKKVKDVTGLDRLVNLEMLSLQGGLYTEIDLTPFAKLKSANVKISKNLAIVKIAGNASITELDVTNTGINELDLTGCVSLTTLTCGSLGLTSFDFIVGGGESLQVINSTFNSLSSLDMKRFPNLTNLDIQYNDGDIVSVDFSANQKLNSLAISNSSMPVDLDLSSCPELSYAKLTSCGITSLLLPQVSNLSTLEIGSNELSELNLKGASKLSRLLCNSNNLTSLDLSSCAMLTYLDVRNNSLTDLNIDGCTAITQFSGDNNQLSDASIFYQCGEITHISLPGNNITSFDPSNLPMLGALDLADNDLKGTLDISTMPDLNMQTDVTGNPSLEKLYISESQATALRMPFFNVQIKWDEETTEVLIVDENGEVIPNPGA